MIDNDLNTEAQPKTHDEPQQVKPPRMVVVDGTVKLGPLMRLDALLTGRVHYTMVALVGVNKAAVEFSTLGLFHEAIDKLRVWTHDRLEQIEQERREREERETTHA